MIPEYSEDQGGFVCVCGAPERAFIQHDDDDTRLICASCGVNYDTPNEGPWHVREDES